jgi:hypothetical protein
MKSSADTESATGPATRRRPPYAVRTGRTGPRSGGVDAVGVLDSRVLPDTDFSAHWDAIILDQQLKDRLLFQAILNFTLRSRVERSDLPLHGLIILHGPPGPGKTSLARPRVPDCRDGKELGFIASRINT